MNASSWSARYKERKMAERRARLDTPRADEQCRKCGVTVPAITMRIYCPGCDAERIHIATTQGLDACEAWLRGDK